MGLKILAGQEGRTQNGNGMELITRELAFILILLQSMAGIWLNGNGNGAQ